jgi:membrane associated rhomboid family serine protease
MAQASSRTFQQAVWRSAWVVSLMFWILVADLLLWHFKGWTLAGFGIVPRTERGLLGIVFSPLLHQSSAHFYANALPLFILLTVLFWDRHYHPWQTLGFVWLGSGLGTWLIGRGDSVHIGASSVIFGLVTYLVAAGLILRSWRSSFVAILVLLAFGGILYGVLPQQGPVSWEGHLSGAIVGVLAAKRNHA